MNKIFRPTWAEINLNALRKNLLKISSLIKPSKLLFVVKADAYGHGAVRIAKFSEKMVWGFGVSSVEEGLILRREKIKKPVLVLGSLYPFKSFLKSIKDDLSVTISSIEAARQVVKAAQKAGEKARCHIKVETGMGRIGVRRPSAVKIYNYLRKSPRAILEGAYSHFSSAGGDAAYTREQLEYFKSTLSQFVPLPAGFQRHIANSSAAVHMPRTRFDLCRCGLACYGLMKGFEPVMSLKTKIVFLKNVRKGSFISYDRSFRCRKAMKIATLPVGYADGYFRAYSNKAHVLVKGRKCKVVGNVTMDMTMADVTALKNATIGDEVALAGKSGGREIKFADLAAMARTIPYEATSLIAGRVPRIYKT